MSNLATLGGHVKVGNWAILGGGVLVHQFTSIGDHTWVGGGQSCPRCSTLYNSKEIIPYHIKESI